MAFPFRLLSQSDGNYQLVLADGGTLLVGTEPDSGGNTGVSLLIEPNIAALSAVDVSDLEDGQPARVQSNGSKWELTTSSVAVDGITVATSTESGRVWQRSGSYIQEQALAQATWVIKPQTGDDEASGIDTNDAIKTFAEMLRRMGAGASPLLSVASVDILFAESQTDNTDPVVFRPQLNNFCLLSLRGAVTTAATVAMTLAQAKDRATSNQLEVGLTATGAEGQLLVNTTHASHAWAYTATETPDTFIVSQPIVPTTNGAEVDTWATGDSVELQVPVSVNLIAFQPVLGDIDEAADNFPTLSSMVAFDPDSDLPGFSPCYLDMNVLATDVRFDRYVVPTGVGQGSGLASFWVNCFFNGSIAGGVNSFVPNPPFLNLQAGIINGPSTDFATLLGLALDADIIVNLPNDRQLSNATGVSFGLVNLIGNLTVRGQCTLAPLNYDADSLWGTYVVDVSAQSSLLYSSATTAEDQFQGSPTLMIDGSNDACSQASSAGVVTIHSGIAVTPANLDAAAGADGFEGVAFQLGGGSITNYTA